MSRFRVDSGQKRLKDIIEYLALVGIAILIAIVGSLFSFRIDLTQDKRHTLSDATTEILNRLDDDIYIQVYLDGDMPVEFKRLRRAIKAMLEEFRIESGRKVGFLFVNPSESSDENRRESFHNELINSGLNPINIMDKDKEGGFTEKMIFPGMILNSGGINMPVNFLRNNPAINAEQNLVNSIEGLEYELIQAIRTISSDTIFKIAFLEGHGELEEIEVGDLTLELAKYFTIDRGTIGGTEGVLDGYSAVVIAKPQEQFTEADKLVIDQYLMGGGSLMWLVEQVYVDHDSLAIGGSLALYTPLNIEDQLFKYGVRINPEIVQDMDCMIIPVRSGFENQQQQYLPVPWIYYPLLYPSAQSPITRNLNKIKGEFVNTIDTVGFNSFVNKEFLAATSPYSRVVSPPRIISLEEYKNPPPEEVFSRSFIPVAVKLEGEFTSLFSGRVRSYNGKPLIEKSSNAKMIVIADGDIIRNEVSRSGNRTTPLPLGFDRYTQQTFGNKDFLVNCLNWLVDDSGIMELRSREVKIRLLDSERVASQRLFWQLLNSVGPILLVLLIAVAHGMIRKRRYGK
jgi:gliding-associated putative ABC transporter substrate-binding component GldG